MNRYTLFIFNISIILLTGCHSKQERIIPTTISTLPSFNIISIDSSRYITTTSIPNGQPLLFIYLSPNCEYCQHEARELVRQREEIKGVYVYIITNGSLLETNKFFQEYHLGLIQNIFVGNDYENSFYNCFKPQTIPFIAVYNREKKLKKVFRGETNIKLVVNATR